MTRHSERGSAILVTLIIVVALLGGGALLLGMQLKATKSTDIARSGMTAMYCAEAGLTAARLIVANNYAGWNVALAANISVPGTEPAFLTALSRDIDGDGNNDFTIVLRDNDDEQAPLANDLNVDNDLQIWIVSTCTKFTDNRKQVSELVRFNVGGTCYQSQLGGCGGNGNAN